MSEQPVPITQYASNSHKSKSEKSPGGETDENNPKPKVQKVITGKVVQKKPSLARKFSETFIADDAQSVGGYILMDVILPAVKDTISSAVSQGVERMLFGENAVRGRGSSRGSRSSGGYTNYSNVSGISRGSSPVGRASGDGETRSLSRTAKSRHNFDEIVLETRGDAEEVIRSLMDLIAQYKVATVSDLYDMVDITPDFTDNKWGWLDDRHFGVQRYGGGFILNLPKPQPLD